MMRLRATSYNVHGFVGRDGRYDPERAARVLQELRPDLVGLQEAAATLRDAEPWRKIAATLGLAVTPGPTLTRSGGAFGNVLLSRAEPEQTRSVDLSVHGREPRRALVATFTGWHAVVTHLGLNARERREQALRLVAALSELGGSLVVLADGNSPWRWSRELRPLDRGYGPAPRLATYPSRWPLLPLDRIWAGNAKRIRTWVHASPLARVASDHLPVCTDLDLEP